MNFLIHHFSINNNKNLKNGFKNVYGIGQSKIKSLTQLYGLRNNTAINKLPLTHVLNIKNFFENKNNLSYLDETLKEQKVSNIKHLIKLRNRKGIRHSSALPVNGQRTRSNHKTCKKLSEFKVIITNRKKRKHQIKSKEKIKIK